MSCKQIDCLFVRIVLWSNSRPTPGLVTYPHQWPNSRSTHSSLSLDNWRGGNLALSLCFANVFFMHITSSRFLWTVAENRRNISSGKGRWRESEYTHWERLFRTFEPWETFHFSLPSLKDEWEVLGRRVGSEVYWLPVSMLLPVIFFLRLSRLLLVQLALIVSLATSGTAFAPLLRLLACRYQYLLLLVLLSFTEC